MTQGPEIAYRPQGPYYSHQVGCFFFPFLGFGGFSFLPLFGLGSFSMCSMSKDGGQTQDPPGQLLFLSIETVGEAPTVYITSTQLHCTGHFYKPA